MSHIESEDFVLLGGHVFAEIWKQASHVKTINRDRISSSIIPCSAKPAKAERAELPP